MKDRTTGGGGIVTYRGRSYILYSPVLAGTPLGNKDMQNVSITGKSENWISSSHLIWSLPTDRKWLESMQNFPAPQVSSGEAFSDADRPEVWARRCYERGLPSSLINTCFPRASFLWFIPQDFLHIAGGSIEPDRVRSSPPQWSPGQHLLLSHRGIT
jgi:hypothetical protein